MIAHCRNSPSASLAVQFNEVAFIVEYVTDEVSKLNIRSHSVDLVKQYFRS